MTFFTVKSGKLTRIKDKKFDYEQDLQILVEKNLFEIFGLEFVRSEFHVTGKHQNLYLDTLAYDPNAEAFVIIEYKKDKSYSVIDQGYAYLAALLDNKAEAILEYQEKTSKPLKKSDVDWNNTRMIFIARQFTPHQKDAVGYKNVPFELWEAQIFENDICSLSQIISAKAAGSVGKLIKNPAVKKVSEEVKAISVEEHRDRGSSEIRKLFEELRKRVLDLGDDIQEKPVKNYIGYRLVWCNFVTVHIYKERIRFYVRLDKLSADPKKRFAKVPPTWGWGKTPLWWIDISGSDDLEYAMPAIIESFKMTPDRP
jgi:predicted transport protein